MPTSRPSDVHKPYTYEASAPVDGQEPSLGFWHSKPSVQLPPGACDCHVHVFWPRALYPVAEDRVFAPGVASVEDLVHMHTAIGIDRVVLVQASTHGDDNRGVLHAAKALNDMGRPARVVAVLPSGTTVRELEQLHAAGVRGLRVNLQSYGETDRSVAASRLQTAAAMAAEVGWHVQTYTNLGVIAELKDVIASLPVPLVVDHFALADPAAGSTQPGWSALLDLVADRNVWVKLSAPYRLVRDLDGKDGRAMARSFIDANADRMLWGTDWPHTGPWPGLPRDRDGEEPFHPIDDGAMLSMFERWTSAEERQKIFVSNPARLYGFK